MRQLGGPVAVRSVQMFLLADSPPRCRSYCLAHAAGPAGMLCHRFGNFSLCGELLAMPPNREPRADGERLRNTNTSPRRRCVLQRCRRTKGRTTIVFPRHFGRCPHHLARFDRLLIHANSIGTGVQEFSYQRSRQN